MKRFYFLIPIILILGNLIVFSTNESFMHQEFQKYNVYSDISNANNIMHEIMIYFNGKENLDVKEFNEREISHMADVKRLYVFTKVLLYLSIITFFILFYFAIRNEPTKILEKISNIIISTSKKGLLFFIIFSLSIALFFKYLFTLFHMLFFKSGTWAFNPATEIIVRVFPEGIFFDIVLYSFILVIIQLLLFLFAGYIISEKFRKKVLVFFKR